MKRKFALMLSLLMILSTMTSFANGKEKVSWLKYDYLGYFSEGLMSVCKAGKYGYVDKNLKEVIKPQFDSAFEFSEGLALVSKNKKDGFIDKTGKVVIPYQFDFAMSFSEGLAAVEKNGKWGFIDKTGKVVIPIQYYLVGSFSGGLAAFSLDNNNSHKGKFGFINTKGEVVIEAQYPFMGSLDYEGFSDGFANVRADVPGEYGMESKRVLIDQKNNIVISGYDYVFDFRDGFARVGFEESKGYFDPKYGYINMKGEEVIPIEYEEIGTPSEGLVMVGKNVVKETINGLSETIEAKAVDLNGNVKFTVPPGSWSLGGSRFHNGYIVLDKWIKVPGKDNDLGSCIFDKNGKLIIPTGKYTSISYIGEGYWAVSKNSSKSIGVFKLPPVK